jgi:hypothetical protein
MTALKLVGNGSYWPFGSYDLSDLFTGDGEYAAAWIMVTFKSSTSTAGKPAAKANSAKPPLASIQNAPESRWLLCTTSEAANFYGSGEIQITPAGSLKIGRITMQRKGGDNGRESANMLQFKINPAELFERKK